MRCLLEAVERFVKTANMRWHLRMDEARWLLHKYRFIQKAMEEYVFDVKLTNGPTTSHGKREQCI